MTQTMFVAYGSAKAALDRMTRNIAPELAPRVRVNAIDVGGVATRSLEVVLTDDDLRRQFVAGTPMGRPGEPEDIACAVLYLVSDASSWVTGKVFEIDGGTEAPAIGVPVPSGTDRGAGAVTEGNGPRARRDRRSRRKRCTSPAHDQGLSMSGLPRSPM